MKSYMQVTTEPASAVVSTADAKTYLRVDGSSEDTLIDSMVGAATRYLENYLGIKFITQTIDIFFDSFPVGDSGLWFDGVREMPVSAATKIGRNIELPIGNVTELTHFKTYSDDETFTHTVSDYVTDFISPRARVGLKLSGAWPTTVLRASNGVNFRVKSGWANAAAVPSDIVQAVKELAAHMYENRGDQKEMQVPAHILSLVEHRRRVQLG